MLLTLIRHGEVEGRPWVFRGHSDPPLSSEGWERMRACVTSLPTTFGRIVSSDLKRCREFAEEWSQATSVPLHIDRRLREIDFGIWEELAPDEVERQFPHEFASFRAAPESWPGAGGESFAQFRDRITSAMHDLYTTQGKKHIALVTHAGVIRQIISTSHNMSYASTLKLDVGYASARQVWYEPPLREPSEKTKVI
jgi:broad specificity phosphatase PhoE